MSITEVMSQLAAIQQLTGQLATPPTPLPGSSSFADALASASSSPNSTTAASGTGSAATAAAASNATSPSTASSPSTAESTLVSSLLEQSQAQALLGTLGDSSSDDGSGGLSDIGEIQSLAALMPSITGTSADSSATAGSTATTGTTALTGTAAGSSVDSTTGTFTGTPAERLLAAAESQLGVTEQPMGSNNGPQIAEYRSAVAGSEPGEPWCAYFASWAAQQAGEPLGSTGQGLGSVAEITSWAASTGRLLPASATPAPGDLILFGDEHVGIVESVNPDGSLTTVEGNYANAVTQVHREPSEATGYVQM
jgi:hypothetical protein